MWHTHWDTFSSPHTAARRACTLFENFNFTSMRHMTDTAPLGLATNRPDLRTGIDISDPISISIDAFDSIFAPGISRGWGFCPSPSPPPPPPQKKTFSFDLEESSNSGHCQTIMSTRPGKINMNEKASASPPHVQ